MFLHLEFKHRYLVDNMTQFSPQVTLGNCIPNFPACLGNFFWDSDKYIGFKMRLYIQCNKHLTSLYC